MASIHSSPKLMASQSLYQISLAAVRGTGPSGCIYPSMATFQNDGRPTWGSLFEGRSPQDKETPHPAGAYPPPLGSALIVLHGGGSEATPPCACGQDLQMQADEGVERHGRKRSVASLRTGPST